VADGDIERRVVGKAVAHEQHRPTVPPSRALPTCGRGVT
jgi:hypothetical protein